jgi:signal transduction histidine kinase
LWTAAIVIGFVSMFSLWAVVRYIIVKPVTHLRDVANAVREGDVEQRAEIHTGDEFEELGAAFNRMLRQLLSQQSELRLVNDELDVRLDELAQANMRLYEMNRLKSDFLATVSHELRTPLTSINGSLALLKSERIGTMPPNAKPLINIAYSNGERLMRLINDILDMETIKSGTLRFVFEELDVGMLVYEAARANAAYAEQLDVKIKVARIPQGIVIMADPDRIAQALANLISNAAKFSPKGGTIDLSVKRTNGWVRICVTDKGEGIPVGFRDRVFSRFAQADSTDARQKGGSGLGLSITKAIAEAHSGKVGFKTAVGKGTTFFIDLPIMAPAAAHTEPQQDKASAPPPGQNQPSLRGL